MPFGLRRDLAEALRAKAGRAVLAPLAQAAMNCAAACVVLD
jgi:hypothetical protein